MLNSIHLDFFFQFQNRATTLGYDLRCGSFYSPDLDNPALWWIHLSFALNLVLTYYYFSVHGRHLGPYSHVWTLSKRIPCLLHPVTLRELFLTFWQLLCWQGISFILFCDLGRTRESIEDPWINGQDLNFFTDFDNCLVVFPSSLGPVITFFTHRKAAAGGPSYPDCWQGERQKWI